MIDRMDIRRARSALATYEAIRRDLRIKYSRVLESRLSDAAARVLSVTGADSIEHAKRIVDLLAPKKQPARESASPPGVPPKLVTTQPSGKPKKRTKNNSRKKPAVYRGQVHAGSTSKSRRHALPVRITSVVSGGLPGSSRRH